MISTLRLSSALHFRRADFIASVPRLGGKYPRRFISAAPRRIPLGKFLPPFSKSATRLFSSTSSFYGAASEGENKSPKKSRKKSSPLPKPAKTKAPKKLVPPKRPMNIMQLVTQEVISEVQAREGKLSKESARECFRAAAEKYRLLSAAEKQSYRDRLDEMRVQYDIEMKAFLDSLTPADYVNQNEYLRRRKAQGRSSRRRGIPRIDPNAPKRPLNGFMIFCSDVRSNPSKFPGLESLASEDKAAATTAVEESKLLASYWKTLEDGLKQSYIAEGQRRSDLYKQEKIQYDALTQVDKAKL